MRAVISVMLPISIMIAGCSDELTRDKAKNELNSFISGKYATASVALGTLPIGSHRLFPDTNLIYKSLLDQNIIKQDNCEQKYFPYSLVENTVDFCVFSLTEKGQSAVEKNLYIDYDGLSSQLKSKCYSGNSTIVVKDCEITHLRVASFGITSIMGISDTPFAGVKMVEYQINTEFTPVGQALGLNKNIFIQRFVPATFRKYDEGWRIQDSPIR